MRPSSNDDDVDHVITDDDTRIIYEECCTTFDVHTILAIGKYAISVRHLVQTHKRHDYKSHGNISNKY